VLKVGTLTIEGPTDLIASNSSTNTALTRGAIICTVKDSSNIVLAGQTVTFYTNGGGSFSASTVTSDADGIAATTFNGQNALGQIKVWAQIGYKKSNELTINITAGPAAKATVLTSATSVGPGQTATLTVLVTDANTPGYPVNGVNVSGAVTASQSGGPGFLGFDATDANGQATLTYTAGTTAGTDTITISSGAITKTININVTAVASEIKSMVLTLTRDSLTASLTDYSRVTATILDGDGNGVADTDVAFETTLGGLRAISETTGAGTSTLTVKTGTNGQAAALLVAGTNVGTALVEATILAGNYASKNVSIVAGAPSSVTLSTFLPKVEPGKSADLYATVLDSSSNPVKNETLLFNISTNVSGGILSSLTATTDALGRATVKYTAGVNALGIDKVTVSTSNLKTATVDETVVAALIGSLNVSLGNSSMVADGISQTFVRALLKDINNQPMTAGVPVTFTTTGGGLSNASANTIAGGIAEVRLTSPEIVGSATVSASAQGIIGSQVVTFTAGAPAVIVMTANPTTVSIGGAVTLIATVTDSKGNLVPNQAVQFNQSVNISGGTLSSLSATTDANGRATVTYTAGGTATPVDDPATALPIDEAKYDVLKAEIVAVSSDPVEIAVSTAAVRLSSLTVTAIGGTSLVANGTSKTQIDAIALDTNGAGYPNVPITFAASVGTLVDSDGVATTSGITDANGVATVFLNSTTTPGISLITATTGGFNAGTQVDFIPGSAAESKSTIVAEPNAIPSDGISTTTVTVSLIDANGNPVVNGTSVTLVSEAGTITSANPALTQSGRAIFNLKSSSTANATVALTTPQLAGLAGNVVFGALSDGKPANILLSSSDTHLFVAGVGKTENTNVNVRIVDIDGADIPIAAYNNLRITWSTHPMGGEYMSGSNITGVAQRINDSTNSMLVFAGQGGATLFFQSGTLPGVIEVLFEVVDSTGTALTPAVRATLPQLVISSGAPHTVVLTHPITDSVENLGGGIYRRVGKGIVTDRYGNSVPDGTAIYLGLTDSVLATGTAASTTAASAVLTDASPKKADGTATAFTTASLVRDGVSRYIQNNDRILLLNSESADKSRHVSGIAAALTANKNYVNAASSLDYVIGASLLGGFVQGLDAAGNKVTGQAVTKDGLFTFYVTYPADSGSIMTGCNSRFDTRVDVLGSAQVYTVAASSDDRATTINAGEFCFVPIAGATLAPQPGALTGSGTVGFLLEDGGDTVAIPFAPISSYVEVTTLGKFNGCVNTAITTQGTCTSSWHSGAASCIDRLVTTEAACILKGASWNWTADIPSNFSVDVYIGDSAAGSDMVTGFTTEVDTDLNSVNDYYLYPVTREGGIAEAVIKVRGAPFVRSGDAATVHFFAADAEATVDLTIP
jgi:hypothetical protein